MPAVTLRPSRLVSLLALLSALCGRTSAAALPDRAAPFLFRREAADAHGLTGGQIVIIASVAILGVVALVVAGIVGCYLCAKIEYADRQRRRELGIGMEERAEHAEEQGLVSFASIPERGRKSEAGER